jgi:serine/threonine protein kinase
MEKTVDGSLAESISEPTKPVVSQRLGRFVILRQLGEGGMGSVFAAYDDQLDRKVALKLIHPLSDEMLTHRLRVLREAQAMARVAHPNVVHVYDVGEIGAQIFIAMEYIDGMTLSQWQAEPHSQHEILHVYRQAAQGLHAAHQAGLVHREACGKMMTCFQLSTKDVH